MSWGLLLLGFAAGAPLLPKLAEAGRADVASATALMVLLMAASVVVMPLALPLFVKGAQVNPWQIAAPLVVLMLAPLALGMAARQSCATHRRQTAAGADARHPTSALSPWCC